MRPANRFYWKNLILTIMKKVILNVFLVMGLNLLGPQLFAQTIINDVGDAHNQVLNSLKLSPTRVANFSDPSYAFNTTKTATLSLFQTTMSSAIDPKIVSNLVTYFTSLFTGQPLNSIGISDNLHRAFIDLINTIVSTPTPTPSIALSTNYINQYLVTLNNWYKKYSNSSNFTIDDKNKLSTFYAVAVKSPLYWYTYLNNNNLQSLDCPNCKTGRHSFWHWLGVAIMDAGGAFIGSAWGVGGAVAVGAAASCLAAGSSTIP
jgi:hypothetical protein